MVPPQLAFPLPLAMDGLHTKGWPQAMLRPPNSSSLAQDALTVTVLALTRWMWMRGWAA